MIYYSCQLPRAPFGGHLDSKELLGDAAPCNFAWRPRLHSSVTGYSSTLSTKNPSYHSCVFIIYLIILISSLTDISYVFLYTHTSLVMCFFSRTYIQRYVFSSIISFITDKCEYTLLLHKDILDIKMGLIYLNNRTIFSDIRD